MKVIPSIDLLGGKVVRLYQGDFTKVTVYFDDPFKAIDLLISKGAKRVHIVDLEAAKNSLSNEVTQNKEIIKNLVLKYGTQLDFQVGGGIRKKEEVESLFAIGIKKVVIGSLIFTDYGVYDEIVKAYGDRVILALDVNEGVIKRSGWQVSTNMTIEDLIDSGKIGSVYALMSTDISVDGSLTGPNLKMMEKLSKSNFRWIASGGVTSRNDLEALSKLNLYGAILGKSVFEGLVEDLTDIEYK